MVVLFSDLDYVKCYDQVLLMVNSDKMDRALLEENKYCSNLTICDISNLFEDDIDDNFRKNDEHVEAYKKDFEAVESFKNAMINSMEKGKTLDKQNQVKGNIPLILDDENSIKSNIPIITDEDSTKFRFNQNKL